MKKQSVHLGAGVYQYDDGSTTVVGSDGVERPMNPPNPKQRYGDLKVPLGLVPSTSMIYEALALAEGARKYGPYNWRETGVEAMTYVHAMLRHLYAYMDGLDIDPSSGQPHLGHLKACAGILADATECDKLIDNRPAAGHAAELLECYQVAPEEPGKFYGEEVPATSWPYPQDKPLTDEAAEKLKRWLDEPCPLDGRNCSPDHDHRPTVIGGHSIETCVSTDDFLNLLNTFGTSLIKKEDLYAYFSGRKDALVKYQGDHPAFGEGDETDAGNPVPDPEHIHRWVIEGEMMVCRTCGETRPVVRQKPGQYAIDFDKKHPCICRDMDRCRVDNGQLVGNSVFCRKAEAGR